MTRIDSPPTPGATPELDRPGDLARETQPHRGKQFATLYHGTTRFTYTQTRLSDARGSAQARKLAALNARKRNAARRTAARRPSMNGGEERASGDGATGGNARITRDGGGGGRGGSGGQSQDGRSSGERAPQLAVKARADLQPVPPLQAGALQAFLIADGARTDSPDALPRLWCEGLLALRDELARHPQAPLDARMHEWFLDLLAVQQQHGIADGGGMSAWRQRLIDAGSARDTPDPDGAAATQTARAESADAPSADATPRELNRVQRLNLLMPLLAFVYEKPATASQRERSAHIRMLQRGAARTRDETA